MLSMNSSFEKQLEEKGNLVYHNVGDSMLPLIKQGRDLMVLERPNRRPKKYDAVLYKRPNGQYVMHRIIGENKYGFILCGDNRYDREYSVQNEQILALLTAVVRNGKEIKADSFKYKIYARLWCDFFHLRRLILMVKGKFKNAKKQR